MRIISICMDLPLIILFLLIKAITGRSFDRDLIKEINQSRQEVGLKPICLSPKLTIIAQRYADVQASLGKGGHYADGKSPDIRAIRFRPIAENLFEGFSLMGGGKAAIVHQAIMNHPQQRDNIYSNRFSHVGIGRAETERSGQRYYYWVQLFARTSELCSWRNPLGSLAGQSLAEAIAPPEQVIQIKHSFNEPEPGAGGLESVQTVHKTYLDTIPRIEEDSTNPYYLTRPKGNAYPSNQYDQIIPDEPTTFYQQDKPISNNNYPILSRLQGY